MSSLVRNHAGILCVASNVVHVLWKPPLKFTPSLNLSSRAEEKFLFSPHRVLLPFPSFPFFHLSSYSFFLLFHPFPPLSSFLSFSSHLLNFLFLSRLTLSPLPIPPHPSIMHLCFLCLCTRLSVGLMFVDLLSNVTDFKLF